MIEEELQRSGRSQCAAGFVEIAADVAHGACGVVRGSLHEDGDAKRAVALVVHLLVVRVIF